MAQSAPPTLGQAALDAPGDGVHISFATRERYETIENTPRTGYAPPKAGGACAAIWRPAGKAGRSASPPN
jgi:hypothetical protein